MNGDGHCSGGDRDGGWLGRDGVGGGDYGSIGGEGCSVRGGDNCNSLNEMAVVAVVTVMVDG